MWRCHHRELAPLSTICRRAAGVDFHRQIEGAAGVVVEGGVGAHPHRWPAESGARTCRIVCLIPYYTDTGIFAFDL